MAGAAMVDLIVPLDDATSEIYAVNLVCKEGILSSLRARAAVIAAKGLFCSLHVDRRRIAASS